MMKYGIYAISVVIIILLIWVLYPSKEEPVHKNIHGQWKAEQSFCDVMNVDNLSLFIGASGNPRKCVLIVNEKTLTIWITFSKGRKKKGGILEYTINFKFPSNSPKLFKQKSIFIFNKNDNIIFIKKNGKIQVELFKDTVTSAYAKKVVVPDIEEYSEPFDPVLFDVQESQALHTQYVNNGGLDNTDNIGSIWDGDSNTQTQRNYESQDFNDNMGEYLDDNDDLATEGLRVQKIRDSMFNDTNINANTPNPIKDGDFSDLIKDFNRKDNSKDDINQDIDDILNDDDFDIIM